MTMSGNELDPAENMDISFEDVDNTLCAENSDSESQDSDAVAGPRDLRSTARYIEHVQPRIDSDRYQAEIPTWSDSELKKHDFMSEERGTSPILIARIYSIDGIVLLQKCQ